MKKIAFIFSVLIALCSFSACSRSTDPAEVNIYDQAGLLSASEKEHLIHLFDSCYGKAIKIVIDPENLTYEQAMDAKAKAGLTFHPLENKYDVAITYFPKHKRLFVDIQGSQYQNIYDRKFALPIYRIQAQTRKHKDYDNIILSANQMADMLKHSDWTRAFAPIYSIVDYLNDDLIRPSNKILHLFFFRIPLYIVLSILYCVHSLGWTIAIIMLLLFVWIFFYIAKPEHGLLLTISRWFHLILLTTAICLVIPSYDTVTMIDNMGFSQAANILNTSFLNASSSGSGWFASIVFAILIILYGGLNVFTTPSDKIADMVGSQETADSVIKHIGFVILSFIMPGNIVWAINAYLLEKILLLFLRAASSGGSTAKKPSELSWIIVITSVYIIIITCWRICLIDWSGWHNFTQPLSAFLNEDGFLTFFTNLAVVFIFMVGIIGCSVTAFIKFLGWWGEVDKLSPQLLSLPHKDKKAADEIHENWGVNIWHFVVILLFDIAATIFAMLFVHMQ